MWIQRHGFPSLPQPCILPAHALNKTRPRNYFQGRLCPKALILSTAEEGSDDNYSAAHYTNTFRKRANLGKIPRWSRGQGEKRQRKLMLRPLPGHCCQWEPSTVSLLTRCLLALQVAASWADGRIGKSRGKKGEFFIEENKYGDMETGQSANRAGLGFDGAAGSQVAVRVQGFEFQPFRVLHQASLLQNKS